MRSTLDNFSDENEEKNITPSENAPKEGSDIEFDETIDIDELQKTLLEQMQKEDEDIKNAHNEEDTPMAVSEIAMPAEEQNQETAEEQPQIASDQEEQPKPQEHTPAIPKDIKDLPELNKTSAPESKKYVIYIDGENVPFIENLSLHDRKLIINKILKEEDERIKRERTIEERKRYTTHVIIAVMTLILAIPILIFVINKSVNITMINYKQSKHNFEKLYRAHGKVQPKFPVLPAPPKI